MYLDTIREWLKCREVGGWGGGINKILKVGE